MKKLLLLFCIFFASFAYTQTTATTDSAKPEASAQAISVTKVANDKDIATRIREILIATTWYQDIQVSVRDGVVFLDGTATTEEQKQWARDLAAKTQDVVAVVNRLKIDATPNWSFTPAFQEVKRLAAKFVRALPLVVLTLIIIPLAWLLARIIYHSSQRVFKRRLGSPLLADIIAKIVALPAILIALYIILQVAGLTSIALSLLGGAGVLGLVLGFAFQDIAENFLASVLLSLRHPFRTGDSIEVAGHSGIVQSMNTRSTVLLSAEGNHIQIPNSLVFKSIIYNYSTAPARRNILSVGIGYDAVISEAQQLIMTLLKEHEGVIDDPQPLVLVDNLGAATVDLKIYYWFDGSRFDKLKLQSALLRLIKQTLIANHISMPDDAREIIFPEGVPILAQVEKSTESTEKVTKNNTPIATEVDTNSVTEAEGNLANEKSELESQAGGNAPDEAKQNLLSEN